MTPQQAALVLLDRRRVTYVRGPIGVGVCKDGRPVGVIKRAHGVFLLSIDGFRPGADPATRGKHTFSTLKAAKAKAEKVLIP